jgi:hypothetical protein
MVYNLVFAIFSFDRNYPRRLVQKFEFLKLMIKGKHTSLVVEGYPVSGLRIILT